jgi:NAD(P)H-dependent FMN reductase
MNPLNFAIVISTTRLSRFGEKAAKWVRGLAENRVAASYEVVDLRDHPLPFFDEPVSPVSRPSPKQEVRRWANRIARFDGYLFVTAEYNHGLPAVLKNAIDHVYPELNRKPAAFLGYGGMGGARAIEQLRLNLITLEMAPLRSAVHIGMAEFAPMMTGEKSFNDFPYFQEAADKMLEELEWWGRALAEARNGQSQIGQAASIQSST